VGGEFFTKFAYKKLMIFGIFKVNPNIYRHFQTKMSQKRRKYWGFTRLRGWLAIFCVADALPSALLNYCFKRFARRFAHFIAIRLRQFG
jgi:hypothetical protein